MSTALSKSAPATLAHLLGSRPQYSEGAAWLHSLRAEAVERVGALTVPTTRDEDWRYTDLSALSGIPLQPPAVSAHPSALEACTLPEATARLVFIDGCYAPALSSNRSGIVVENLADAVARNAPGVEAHLAKQIDFRGNVFAALNTAFLRDGAWIEVPAGARAGSVHIVYANTSAGARYPRCLVKAGRDSVFTLVEEYADLGGGGFTNAVSECSLEAGACMDHVRVQREPAQALHIAHAAVSIARGARYHAVNVTLGAKLSRHSLELTLAEDARCTVDGVAMIGGEQLADTYTRIVHAAPRAASRQLHKCIVDGAARAVFSGRIVVQRDAQLTDAAQSTRSLLMSPRAQVDVKPQLEILADDVKCAHGAAIGQLDPDEIFYLRSRGLSEAAARGLLTYAFGGEVLDRIPVASLRHALERALMTHTEGRS